MRPIIDAHLDLAWNALYFNRDLLASVTQVRAAERNLTDELSRGREHCRAAAPHRHTHKRTGAGAAN
jgi:hypothetical protein